ncbi:alpha/beta hydrolase [Aspergillus alliaceus]|uniref:alpha/beta hydrolase n=1 Tax=Petromyces alliaceus TaxID=209559 RepID=UPI0012A53B04|nr:alpha/beta-hydrolase [Aspergillus alliaceus]KAB8236078.1 alpha/beta-hydrolase [Aspergillus alliaceus]
MSVNNFQVIEHTVPGCHIREYAGSTAGRQEEVLHLHVKQYTPLDQPKPPSPDAVTIIAAHGIGLAKELYEPLWDEVLQRSKQNGFQIRSIWVADVANMGMSGVINEDKLSTDCSWLDHPRDLLLMINHFRDQMPRPLVGLGHSFGGTIMTNLAYLHPRLFTTLILLDPAIQLNPPPMGFVSDPPGPINFTLYRPDVWPSRQAATAAYRKMFPKMDRRCVDRMEKFGFRDLPTALHPELLEGSDPSNPPVTLTTSKYQDLLGQARANFSARTPDGRIQVDRSTHADMDPLAAFIPVYRPEPRSTFLRLPTLRPSVLWVLGEKSYLRLDEIREGIKTCGDGVGGSGGASQGKVKEVEILRGSHFFPFENVAETAEFCASWLGQELLKFVIAEKEWARQRHEMSKRAHLVLGEDWFKTIKPMSAFRPANKPRKERL